MTTALATIGVQSPTSDHPGLADALAEFWRLRPRLIGIASRILGRRSEAEDIVQDAWLRWQSYDRRLVLNPTAFLVTTTTRLAINASNSARAHREVSIGDWLPEPVDTRDSPAIEVERGETLQVAMGLVLQRLAPPERAAYILRQAFDYPYPRIASLLRISEANARQLVSRAGKHIAVAQGRPPCSTEQQRLAHAFGLAAQHGDPSVLEDLFTTWTVAGQRRSSVHSQKAESNVNPRANHRPRSRSVRRVRQLEPGHRVSLSPRHGTGRRSPSTLP